jgi:hypothetical protein
MGFSHMMNDSIVSILYIYFKNLDFCNSFFFRFLQAKTQKTNCMRLERSDNDEDAKIVKCFNTSIILAVDQSFHNKREVSNRSESEINLTNHLINYNTINSQSRASR